MTPEQLQAKVHKEKYKVSSDDVLCVVEGQNLFYQECCGCGLQHRVEIVERHPQLKLRFVNIGRGAAEEDCKAQGYTGFETHIEVSE